MKNKSIRLSDAYSAPDARFHAATLRALNQIHTKDSRRSMPLPLRAALIAAALLLTVTAIGFATGALQSIFTHMIGNGWDGAPATDYAYLEQTAGREIARQYLKFENGARATATLEQAYYNGEQLALGWSLRPEGEFAWFYDRNDPSYAELHPETEEIIEEDGTVSMLYHGFINSDNQVMFGAELADEFDRRLREDGWAGIAWYDCYLGDGVSLPGVPNLAYGFDGSVLGTTEDTDLDFTDAFQWKDAGASYAYQEYGSLADAARNLDSLKIKTCAYSTLRWYCEDASGRYYGYSEPRSERQEIIAEVPRSERFAERSYSADMSFPSHTAHLTLRMTPIYAEFSFESALPEEWISVWHNRENFPDDKMPLQFPLDVFYCYEFYAEIDGELQFLPAHNRSDEYPFSAGGTFVLPDGAIALHIRPVYYNSGAHETEDFIISLG